MSEANEDEYYIKPFFDLQDPINFKSFETRLNKLIAINDYDEIELHFSKIDEQTLDKVAAINERLKSTNLIVSKVVLDFDEEYIEDPKKIQEIIETNKLCKSAGVNLYIHLGGKATLTESTVENFLVSKKVLDEFVEKVKNFKVEIDGVKTPLSPLEKFMLVYRFASSHIYHASNDDDENDMRNWIGALSTDFIICSGFSSLLKCLCDHVFTEDELKCFRQSLGVYDKDSNEYLDAHSSSYIYIKDEKYGIEGIFYCDACYDCMTQDQDSRFEFFMLPFGQLKNFKKEKFVFDGIGLPYLANNLDVEKDLYSMSDNDEFLLKKYGYKTFNEIAQEYIDDLSKKNNDKIVNKVIKKIEKLKNRDELTARFLNSKLNFSHNVCEHFPIIKKVQNYLQHADPEKPLDEKIMREYLEFLKNNRLVLMLNSNSVKDNERALYWLEEALLKSSSQTDPYYSNEKYHQARIKKIYEQHLKNFIKEHKDILVQKPLPKEAIERAMLVVAQFEGLSDGKDKMFAEHKTKQRQELIEQDFEQDTDPIENE